MVAWVGGFEVRDHPHNVVIMRFARWGATHGPLWGLAAAIVAMPLSSTFSYDVQPVAALGIGGALGALGGPVLGTAVGAVCLAADHVPKWLLDAPDYVAVLAVAGASALVAWPLLNLSQVTLSVAIIGLLLLIAVPLADAARNAPRLLRPTSSER